MTKEIAKSKKAKLLNIAKKQNLDYQILLIRFFYERLLYRLSVSKFKDKFCLKGGTLLYALDKETSRPTLDIDFLGLNFSNEMENIKNAFAEILAIECENDGVIFDAESIKTTELSGNKRYTGIRVSYIAHLDSVKQQMQIDIGFGDVITPAPQNLRYPLLFDDLPAPEIYAYSLETVVAEKFHAMVELAEANSRYKDFYDVYKIFKTQNIDGNVLKEAIIATFQKLHWKAFLRKIKTEHINFETAVRTITSKLQPIYLTL